MASLDLAIRLATQAVHQDSNKNYEEAARCYRESVILFKQVTKSGRVGHKVQKAIDDKCWQYENRLRKLERHLLDQTDLSKLFRECVNFELQHGTRATDEDASSVDSDDLYCNPFLKKGLDTIRKAKKEDANCHFPEALYFYEQGAGQLLDAVRRGRVPQEQTDSIRIKCLLTHDRCELIRSHLEHGAPLKVRKEYLDSFESSLSSGSGSPDPMFAEEERTFDVMNEEARMSTSLTGADSLSLAQSRERLLMDNFQAQSTHSLYPTCVEVKRSPSVMSGTSDFAAKGIIRETEERDHLLRSPIPLAEIDSEMQLSLQSLASNHSSKSFSKNTILRKSLRKSVSMSGEEGDSLLAAEICNKLSISSISLGQRDRNMSEITYNPEVYKARSADSGSDSGFSDPNCCSDTVQGKSPVQEERRKSPMSVTDSLDFVVESQTQHTSPAKTPTKMDSPTPSVGSTGSRVIGRRKQHRSGGSSGSSVQLDPDQERVTVLSEETVIDPHAKAASPEVYHKTRTRPEYIPSRATLSRIDEESEDDVNKGCYYFMACLDTFWIL